MNRRLMEYLEVVYPNDPAKHKYMAIIADNPDVFKTDKISSISAINPKTGEVSNTVSNDKLNAN